MRTPGGETERHRELKRRCVVWAVAHGFRACGMEVRVPRSAFRGDVAGASVDGAAGVAPGETAIFECKQVRADLLRDTAEEQATAARLREVSARRAALELMIGSHVPSLRRGETLFAECDDYDFDAIRHDGLRAIRREEAALQAKLYTGTKFARMRRYRVADRLYLVVTSDVLAPHEVPEGWGLLIAAGDGLEMLRPPARLEAGAGARLALLQAIALAGTRRCLGDLGIDWDELAARRAETFPP